MVIMNAWVDAFLLHQSFALLPTQPMQPAATTLGGAAIDDFGGWAPTVLESIRPENDDRGRSARYQRRLVVVQQLRVPGAAVAAPGSTGSQPCMLWTC
jgi:hypothetical protein